MQTLILFSKIIFSINKKLFVKNFSSPQYFQQLIFLDRRLALAVYGFTKSKLLKTGIHYSKMNCIQDLMKQLKRVIIIDPDKTMMVELLSGIQWAKLKLFQKFNKPVKVILKF